MRSRSRFHRTARLVPWLVLLIFVPSAGLAGPVITFGGGVSTGGLLDTRNDPWAPMGWASVGGALGDSWSGFARVGYERHRASFGLPVCLSTDCPSLAIAERRASYLPLSLGLRLSAPRPALSRLRAYVEAASSLVWANYERDVDLVYPGGARQRELRSSEHWLAGVELGAGLSHRLLRGVGLEWGLRYAYRGAPRATEANGGLDTGRDGFSQMSMVAALTMGP